MKEQIINLLKAIPSANEIAYQEMSFEMTAGTIVVLVVVILLMPAFIFSIIGEKFSA